MVAGAVKRSGACKVAAQGSIGAGLTYVLVSMQDGRKGEVERSCYLMLFVCFLRDASRL